MNSGQRGPFSFGKWNSHCIRRWQIGFESDFVVDDLETKGLFRGQDLLSFVICLLGEPCSRRQDWPINFSPRDCTHLCSDTLRLLFLFLLLLLPAYQRLLGRGREGDVAQVAPIVGLRQEADDVLGDVVGMHRVVIQLRWLLLALVLCAEKFKISVGEKAQNICKQECLVSIVAMSARGEGVMGHGPSQGEGCTDQASSVWWAALCVALQIKSNQERSFVILCCYALCNTNTQKLSCAVASACFAQLWKLFVVHFKKEIRKEFSTWRLGNEAGSFVCDVGAQHSCFDWKTSFFQLQTQA